MFLHNIRCISSFVWLQLRRETREDQAWCPYGRPAPDAIQCLPRKAAERCSLPLRTCRSTYTWRTHTYATLTATAFTSRTTSIITTTVRSVRQSPRSLDPCSVERESFFSSFSPTRRTPFILSLVSVLYAARVLMPSIRVHLFPSSCHYYSRFWCLHIRRRRRFEAINYDSYHREYLEDLVWIFKVYVRTSPISRSILTCLSFILQCTYI